MLPLYETPGGDELRATVWSPGARTLLQRLKTELHAHQVMSTLTVGEGQPRLLISAELIVWVDPGGTLLCGGRHFLEEPADRYVIGEDDLPGAAERIATLHASLATVPTAPAP